MGSEKKENEKPTNVTMTDPMFTYIINRYQEGRNLGLILFYFRIITRKLFSLIGISTICGPSTVTLPNISKTTHIIAMVILFYTSNPTRILPIDKKDHKSLVFSIKSLFGL